MKLITLASAPRGENLDYMSEMLLQSYIQGAYFLNLKTILKNEDLIAKIGVDTPEIQFNSIL